MLTRVTRQVAMVKGTAADLRSEDRGRYIAIIIAFTFLYTGGQMSFPVLLPHLRNAYGLDLTLAGLLISVLWLVKAVCQFPSGVLSDRVGEGNVMTLSALLGGTAMLLLVVADNVVVLFVATGIFGVGVALQAMSRYTALADLYPERIGTATGVSLAAADAGQSLLPPLAGILAAWTAWQLGFGFTIPLFVLMGVLIRHYIPARTSSPSSPIDSFSTESVRYVGSELATPPVLLGTVILAIYFALWVAFSSFYPTYLIDVKGQSEPVAGVLFGLFFISGVVVKPLAGTAFDRIDIGRTFVVVGGVSGLALMTLPAVDSVPAIALLTILVSPILGSGTLSMSLLLEELPDDVQGSGFGLIRTLTLGIASVSPVLFGTVAESGFFDEGFVLLGVLAWSMIPLAVLAARTN